MSEKKSLVRGIVLAGGEGKRLRPLSFYFQKCMIPIGHQQKPLLEYIVRLLGHHGIPNISLLVGYKQTQIMNYFNHGDRFGVRIEYLTDHPKLTGTGGALLNYYRKGLTRPNEDLVVYYGDIVSNLNLTEMLTHHRQSRAAATVAVSKGYPVRVGVADLKGDNITGWTEKPTVDLIVGIGILILKAPILQELELLHQLHAPLDIMSHLIPHLIQNDKVVSAYVTDAFWYDVGSTERYEKLENEILEKHLGELMK